MTAAAGARVPGIEAKGRLQFLLNRSILPAIKSEPGGAVMPEFENQKKAARTGRQHPVWGNLLIPIKRFRGKGHDPLFGFVNRANPGTFWQFARLALYELLHEIAVGSRSNESLSRLSQLPAASLRRLILQARQCSR